MEPDSDYLLDRDPAGLKILTKSPLGSYREAGCWTHEYHVGRRLIWQRCAAARPNWSPAALELLHGAWLAIPDVLTLAEAYSRPAYPAFWAAHDRSNRKGYRLDVWGLTIKPCSATALYVVSRNHNFDFESPATVFDGWEDERHPLPDFPEPFFIHILRSAAGTLSGASGELSPWDECASMMS